MLLEFKGCLIAMTRIVFSDVFHTFQARSVVKSSETTGMVDHLLGCLFLSG